MTPEQIADEVAAERDRQRAKWNRPHSWGFGDCSDHRVPSIVKAAVLAEEAGEVVKATLDQDMEQIRTETIQTMAVCHAILESLPARPVTRPVINLPAPEGVSP